MSSTNAMDKYFDMLKTTLMYLFVGGAILVKLDHVLYTAVFGV